jgi:hypothetical protein
MRIKRRYLLLISIVALTLITLQALGNSTVNNTTLGLLVFAAAPILWPLIESIKAGGVEINFRQLSMQTQIFTFLDGIATQRMWTFYPCRDGESELGNGFAVLVRELIDKGEKDLLAQLEKWLDGYNNNHRWFAAEIIGFFRIEKMKDELQQYYENLDKDDSWEPWQLNCLWAYSQFYEFQPLHMMLLSTKNESNRLWILDAYYQMVKYQGSDEKTVSTVRLLAENIQSQKDISPSCKLTLQRILSV